MLHAPSGNVNETHVMSTPGRAHTRTYSTLAAHSRLSEDRIRIYLTFRNARFLFLYRYEEQEGLRTINIGGIKVPIIYY
jgi:hypothetical protein